MKQHTAQAGRREEHDDMSTTTTRQGKRLPRARAYRIEKHARASRMMTRRAHATRRDATHGARAHGRGCGQVQVGDATVTALHPVTDHGSPGHGPDTVAAPAPTARVARIGHAGSADRIGGSDHGLAPGAPGAPPRRRPAPARPPAAPAPSEREAA